MPLVLSAVVNWQVRAGPVDMEPSHWSGSWHPGIMAHHMKVRAHASVCIVFSFAYATQYTLANVSRLTCLSRSQPERRIIPNSLIEITSSVKRLTEDEK
jgi:hypothetical protein